MIAYILRRIGTSLIVLVGVSLGVYLLLHAVYPSPARDIMGEQAKEVAILAWNKANGFDQPVMEQYLRWVGNLFKGNLGYSYKDNQTVAALFAERVWRSAWLTGVALLIALFVGLPLGLFQAVKRNSIGDNVATSLSFILYSMPSFFLGIILIQVFSINFHVFQFEADQSTSIFHVMGDWYAMTLPIVTQALVIIALFSRYMRSSSMDVLAQDYIKVARAKGLPEKLVLVRHLLRNACLPMITLLGLSLPALLAGNLIIESLFNFQGLGELFFTSLSTADYPTLLAYVLVGTVFTILGNFIADVALTMADPRIRMA